MPVTVTSAKPHKQRALTQKGGAPDFSLTKLSRLQWRILALVLREFYASPMDIEELAAGGASEAGRNQSARVVALRAVQSLKRRRLLAVDRGMYELHPKLDPAKLWRAAVDAPSAEAHAVGAALMRSREARRWPF